MFPGRGQQHYHVKKLTNTSLSSFGSISSILFTGRRQNAASQRRCSSKVRAAKELYSNKDGSATKKLQIGVNKLSNLVGVTLGSKGRNVVLERKHGSPKIVNDGVTVAKEVELEDPVENIGTKLVRQAAANINDLDGDGITTSVVLGQGLIKEGVKVHVHDVLLKRLIMMWKVMVECHHNQCQVIEAAKNLDTIAFNEKLSDAHFEVIKKLELELPRWTSNFCGAPPVFIICNKWAQSMEDMISEEEAAQALRGFALSVRYFWEWHNTELRMRIMVDTKALERDELKMQKEWQKLLFVGKKITNAKDLIVVLQEPIRIAALKAHGFGERKSQYLDDIAILTGATVIREKAGLSLDKVEKEVLCHAAKVHKLKEKKLRAEDALNATKAVVEEGIAIGGDCTLLRLVAKVDAIKLTLDNDEQKVLLGRSRYCQKGFELSTEVDCQKCGDNRSVVMEMVYEYTSTHISIILVMLKNVLYINCNVKY
ncbi:hypothetical protein GIB67_012049 [Kingdonia uniflora]|uniref:Uncharacterized protein n=1 Tax=Kingdonia uniflora TaxID=39325 RepID=A0A7J7M0E3_9MAGN|nr:hypothetical protein GIB67_012049 [Kingdonia uniflora]